MQLVWTHSGELSWTMILIRGNLTSPHETMDRHEPVFAKRSPGPEGCDRQGGIARFLIDLGMTETFL